MAWRVRGDRGTLPPEVDLAVVGAAEEALTNVARHSGLREVTVTGSIDDSVALDIIDGGVGFDPRAPRPGRIGIDRGISARLGRVGGSASVLSTPGGGTTVRLRVAVHPHVATDIASVPVELWKHRDFLAIFVLGCVMTVVFCVIGASQHHLVVSPWVLVVAVVAVPSLGLVAAFAPAGRQDIAAALTVGVTGVVLLGTSNLRNPYDGTWGLWFVGALNATETLLVGRFSAFWGGVAVAGAGGGMALGQLHRGGVADLGLIVVVLPQMLAFGARPGGSDAPWTWLPRRSTQQLRNKARFGWLTRGLRRRPGSPSRAVRTSSCKRAISLSASPSQSHYPTPTAIVAVWPRPRRGMRWWRTRCSRRTCAPRSVRPANVA